VTPDEEHAARLVPAERTAVMLSGGVYAPEPRRHPARIHRAALAALPLPAAGTLGKGMTVAMADGGTVERHADAESLRAAYQARPRTRVFEDIGWENEQGWAWLAGQHLTRLADTGLRVTVSVSLTEPGDEEPGARREGHLGVIVQVDGTTTWRAGKGLFGLRPGDAGQFTVTPGDMLVIPQNLPAMARPQADAGRSVHLEFAISTNVTTL
jgi:hypothetical protein